MMKHVCLTRSLAAFAALVGLAGCESYPFLPFAEKNRVAGATSVDGSPFAGPRGRTFTEQLLLGRTFLNGTALCTSTYAVGDLTRTQRVIDFNGDGKADAVACYGGDQGVIQILLSDGPVGRTEFISLTLDSRLDWKQLEDVAVGDIDGDGRLDIVAASSAGVVYLRHPADRPTTDLRYWGVPLGETGREIIAGTDESISNDELQALILASIGPFVNIQDYIVTVKQGYSNVEIGDVNNDGHNDIIASRSFTIDLTPRPDRPVEPLQIIDGAIQVLLNPGGATDGTGWASISVGAHERVTSQDRDAASGVLLFDMDGDGNLDIVSAARRDNNVQIAWYRNPGGTLDASSVWEPWRIGSVRDVLAIDVADLTGDGWPDVVATGVESQQLVLFVHPGVAFYDARYEFDWTTHPIVTFQAFEPRDVKALDIDADGRLELVVGGSAGAVRYFEAPADPTTPWQPVVIADLVGQDSPEGEVGLLGFGDFDGDGDLDLLALLNSDFENADRLIWIRNNLNP